MKFDLAVHRRPRILVRAASHQGALGRAIDASIRRHSGSRRAAQPAGSASLPTTGGVPTVGPVPTPTGKDGGEAEIAMTAKQAEQLIIALLRYAYQTFPRPQPTPKGAMPDVENTRLHDIALLGSMLDDSGLILRVGPIALPIGLGLDQLKALKKMAPHSKPS